MGKKHRCPIPIPLHGGFCWDTLHWANKHVPRKQRLTAGERQWAFFLSYITGWWLNQPIWKICSWNWKSSTNRGENKKYLKPPARSCCRDGPATCTHQKCLGSWQHRFIRDIPQFCWNRGETRISLEFKHWLYKVYPQLFRELWLVSKSKPDEDSQQLAATWFSSWVTNSSTKTLLLCKHTVSRKANTKNYKVGPNPSCHGVK